MHSKNHFNRILILAVAFIASGGFAAHAQAAVYSFATSSAVVHMGEEIAVDISVDPEGQNINTVSATVDLPANLAYVGQDDSASIVGLWVDEPHFNAETATFSFSGIILGGFAGQIDLFANDGSHKAGGTIIRLFFKGSSIGAGTLSYEAADAYLSDGLGTETPVSTKTLSLVIDTIIGQALPPPTEDIDPPLGFTPILERDYLLADGKYVAIFNTKDKGSGMDHYEIREGKGPWMLAVSPYVLEDQKVSADILIKAVDRAGNARYETIPALHHLAMWQILGGIGLALGLLLVHMLERRRIPKKKKVV